MNHSHSLNISSYIFFLSLLITPFFLIGQNDYLKPYIPFDSCDLSTHPELKIRVWVHIIQKSPENPENLTLILSTLSKINLIGLIVYTAT